MDLLTRRLPSAIVLEDDATVPPAFAWARGLRGGARRTADRALVGGLGAGRLAIAQRAVRSAGADSETSTGV